MDDEEIIDLLFSRSERALAELGQKYESLAYGQAYGIIHNHETASECVNDSLMAVWDTIPPNRPDHLGAYISRIAKNIALNRFRDEHAKKRSAIIVQWDELEELVGSVAVDDEVALHEVTECINAFLDEQTYENRMIWMGYYWRGVSLKELSKKLGMGQGAVKMRLSRMKKNLKELLSKEGLI